ncbi:MAG: prolyl oligopeptidase family serine peptidase [Rubritepida sp.]|nr:prolyl oligopeptidase family serine peptidase [Rubritepida sp.]
MIRRLCLAAALLLGACAAEMPLSAEDSGETLNLTDRALFTRICRSGAVGPAPLVVINHGSPGDASARAGMRPTPCGNEAVRWFTTRGYLVAIPMRRGYGRTGGPWEENFGRCDQGNYGPGGLEAARDILATVRAIQARPDVSPGPSLVVGQSAGGWGVLALASLNPPEVGAIINMAGGRGGWQGGVPNQVCRPDQLVRAAGAYGGTARLPTLWIYAANDSFFNHAMASQLVEAYRGSGGVAEFHAVPAYGSDGHGLFYGSGGSATWGPLAAAFLVPR